MKVTEQQVFKSNHTTITQHPQLISLLALFQDRDDFIVDHENQTVKPVQEEHFLEEISKDIELLSQEKDLPLPRDMYKERLGDVKNKLLDGLKVRWMKSGTRGSTASQLSNISKRD